MRSRTRHRASDRCGAALVRPTRLLAFVLALAAVACGNDDTPTATSDTGDSGSDSVTVDVVYIRHIPGSDSLVDALSPRK